MSATVDAAIGAAEQSPRGPLDWLFAIPAAVGASTQSALAAIGNAARFVGDTAVAFRDVRTWAPETMVQAMRLGVASLPIALLIPDSPVSCWHSSRAIRSREPFHSISLERSLRKP